MLKIWKDIKDYEDHYEISSLGNVRTKARQVPCKGNKTRNIKQLVKKLCINKRGYNITTLSKENVLATFTVHQLVAQAFLPNFTKSMELNHIDGVKTNNQATNLEVSNPSHNQFHALRLGLKKKTGVSQYHNVSYISSNSSVKKWAVCINHNGKTSFGWKTFMTEIEAAIYVDILLDSINDTSRLRNFPKPFKSPTTIP